MSYLSRNTSLIMFTTNFIVSLSGALSRTYQKITAVTAGSRLSLQEAATGEAVTEIIAAIDVSQVRAISILSNKDVVVRTNSHGSPANIFTLTANVPFVWATPLGTFKDTADATVSTDITSLHVDNEGADEAIIQLDALVDPTV